MPVLYSVLQDVAPSESVERRNLYMSKPLYKPGTDNRPAGKYKEVGPRGGKVDKPREVRIDSGDRLPPTQKEGNRWEKA